MFRGFKAQLNILSGKNENTHLSPDLFVTGAYRVNREDAYGFSSFDSDFRPADQIRPTKSTSNLLQPQTSKQRQDQTKPKPAEPSPLRPVKSTSNLTQALTPNKKLRNSTPAVSSDPRGGAHDNRNEALSPKEIKIRENEQKKIDKQRVAEQKKQAKEMEKQEKLLREKEKKQEKQRLAEQKKQAQEKAKQEKLVQQAKQQGERKKRKNQTSSTARPQQTELQPKPGPSNPRPAYSTNTLESSISRSSGPPPYPDDPKPEPTLKDKTSNVAYSEPVDNGSWDIISQHRQQMSRPVASVGIEAKRKQVLMDLNYKFNADMNKNNSEA